jgi:hypothetical protein
MDDCHEDPALGASPGVLGLVCARAWFDILRGASQLGRPESQALTEVLRGEGEAAVGMVEALALCLSEAVAACKRLDGRENALEGSNSEQGALAVGAAREVRVRPTKRSHSSVAPLVRDDPLCC